MAEVTEINEFIEALDRFKHNQVGQFLTFKSRTKNERLEAQDGCVVEVE